MKPEELDELERLYLEALKKDGWVNHGPKYIASLQNAFPALLALARDGVRYRELFSESETGGLMVQESAMKERK